jgi:hypothetical protein
MSPTQYQLRELSRDISLPDPAPRVSTLWEEPEHEELLESDKKRSDPFELLREWEGEWQ